MVTDASKVGLGAVLEQQHEKGWKPVAFWSRKLRDPETRYSATDLEWLAVVTAVTRVWYWLLDGKEFTICSDHKALERKLHKSIHDPPLNDRQARWIEAMAPFPYYFQWIKGSDNTVADALSRHPEEGEEANANLSVVTSSYHSTIGGSADTANIEAEECHLVPLSQAILPALNVVTVVHTLLAGLWKRLRLVIERDGEYQELISKTVQKSGDPNSGLYYWKGLVVDDEGRVHIPADHEVRTLLISEAHDSPLARHFGMDKTLELVLRRWTWRGVQKDVRDYVRTCLVCQRSKNPTNKP